jgi:hypothetical protein
MEVKADYLQRTIAGGWWVSFAHDDRVLAVQVRNDRGRLALGESRCRRWRVAGVRQSENQLKGESKGQYFERNQVICVAIVSSHGHWLILFLWATGFAKWI